MSSSFLRPDAETRRQRLLAEARRLNVEVSNASEEEVRQAVRKAWMVENAEAIKSCNDWVAKHGLPLAKYRMF